MSKNWRRAVFSVIFLLALGAAVLFWMLMCKSSRWKWKEDSRILSNPDRGFYIQIDSKDPERIPKAAEEVRLVLLAFDLENYEKGDLPKEKTDELGKALETAKEAGVSIIFRAAYGFCKDVSEPGEIERMGGHIRQISEVLNRYKDQILTVQAGMLGAYGEWHSSRHLEGGEEKEKESRLYILRQWEAYLDTGITVAVRRPRFIREAEEEDVLTGRLALHNDALLSTDDDMGTYDADGFTRKDELLWAEKNLLGQANGGEMPTPGKRNEPEYADMEFKKLHLGYLNLKYNEEIILAWSKEKLGGMEAKRYLENHLGYRIFISELHAKKVYFGKSLSEKGMDIAVSFCNVGYAPPISKYKMYFSVRSGQKEFFWEVPAAGLYRISCKETWEGKYRIKIPKELLQENGKIEVGVKLAPEMGETDGRSCIEFANENFNYRDGVNVIFSLEHAGKWFYQIKP